MEAAHLQPPTHEIVTDSPDYLPSGTTRSPDLYVNTAKVLGKIAEELSSIPVIGNESVTPQAPGQEDFAIIACQEKIDRSKLQHSKREAQDQPEERSVPATGEAAAISQRTDGPVEDILGEIDEALEDSKAPDSIVQGRAFTPALLSSYSLLEHGHRIF